jgi:hypothetical protein
MVVSPSWTMVWSSRVAPPNDWPVMPLSEPSPERTGRRLVSDGEPARSRHGSASSSTTVIVAIVNIPGVVTLDGCTSTTSSLGHKAGPSTWTISYSSAVSTASSMNTAGTSPAHLSEESSADLTGPFSRHQDNHSSHVSSPWSDLPRGSRPRHYPHDGTSPHGRSGQHHRHQETGIADRHRHPDGYAGVHLRVRQHGIMNRHQERFRHDSSVPPPQPGGCCLAN